VTHHPEHDGPSTSKLMPLQNTGLGVMLIPSTINTNPTWWDKSATRQWRAFFASL
jgi:hypothetical protein